MCMGTKLTYAKDEPIICGKYLKKERFIIQFCFNVVFTVVCLYLAHDQYISFIVDTASLVLGIPICPETCFHKQNTIVIDQAFGNVNLLSTHKIKLSV